MQPSRTMFVPGAPPQSTGSVVAPPSAQVPAGSMPPPMSSVSPSVPAQLPTRPTAQQQATATVSGLYPSFFIAAHPRMRGSAVASFLRPHTVSYQEIVPDFSTAAAHVMLLEARELAGSASLRRANERLRACQPAAGRRRSYVTLLMMESAENEPHLDVLTFINEACLEVNSTLIVCCGARDAAVHLEHIANTASVSADVLHRPKDANARDAMISGLTETGKCNVSDARRLINKHVTVASILQCDAATVTSGIPGFGAKKATGLVAVLNAPFPTRRRRLEELQATPATPLAAASGGAPLIVDGAVTRPGQPPPSDALALALARLDRVDPADDDSEEDDRPLFFSSLKD